VSFFVVKIGADNWRRCGSLLGSNEIMRAMFAPGSEVVVLLAADGVMCAVTGVGWVLQRGVFGVRGAVRGGVLDWEGGGWVVQHVSLLSFSVGLV
jgi:sterol O-acyltransferase